MRVHRIQQTFPRVRVPDIATVVAEQIQGCGVRFAKGASIAVTAGSRGIANISLITKSIVDALRNTGANPFIVPAMGSHGGATAEGQVELLASNGITEETMGCSIRSSMDVVPIPAEDLPNKAFMDRHAWEADGVVVVNRIKPHTDFHGSYESGLVKMSVIGLGKERQAFELHRFGVHGLRELVPQTAKRVFATGRILMGIGIVENAYDETMHVEAMPAGEIMNREPALLEMARSNMPGLPIDALDVLIVDRLGKNISGTGMDTNIIGRISIPGQPEPQSPRIKSIVVRDLTDESHGNATGIGLADVTTRKLFEKIDFEVTNRNIRTSGFLERGKIPYVAGNDEEALEMALRGAGCLDPESARVVRIADTLHLGEMLVSDSVANELKDHPTVKRISSEVDIWSPLKIAEGAETS